MKQLFLALLFALLAVPAMAQSAADVQRVIDANPAAFACAHTGQSCTDDFIQILASELHKQYPAVGLNGKRGNYNDISDDALAVLSGNSGDCVDQRTGAWIVVIDVIASAGSPNASAAWNRVGCGDGNPGAWVRPAFETPGPTLPPPPPIPSTPTQQDVTAILQKLQALEEVIISLQGDLMDREYVISSIEHFRAQLDEIELKVDDARAQGRMLIETTNRIEALLLNPPSYSGWFGTLRPNRP